MTIDLTQEKTQRLEAELNRRRKLREESEEAKRHEDAISSWKQRPACAVVGRAYGSPHGEKARVLSLATVIIAGNASRRYPVQLTVAPSVETYFHNAWLDEDEAEFSQKLHDLVREFVLTKCNDPAIVTTLICLSENAGWRPLNKEGGEVYDEWHKEALIRLQMFSKDELIDARGRLERNHETAHGQIKLLDEAINNP